jgi:hypothetical protein
MLVIETDTSVEQLLYFVYLRLFCFECFEPCLKLLVDVPNPLVIKCGVGRDFTKF